MSVVENQVTVKGIEDRFEEDYQAISAFCIVSLILGLLSFSGFVSPLLWSLPMIGIVVSIIAILRVRRDHRLMGATAAYIGMTVSCFVLASAPVRHFSRQQALYSQARGHAVDWFEMVQQQEVIEAFEFQLYYHERQPQGSNLENYYAETPAMKMPGSDKDMDLETRMMATPDPYVRMKSFFARPPLKYVAEHPNGEIQFVRNLRIERKTGLRRDKILQLYHYSFEENGARRTVAIEVKLERDFYGGEISESHWRVAECAPPG